jgi:hypothetical protein
MEFTYATVSTILMFICFLHFIIPPVKAKAHTVLKTARALLALSPLAFTVVGMIFASSVAAQVIFGILFGSMMTFAIIRVIERSAEQTLADKTKLFQDRAQAYNEAHEACDELIAERAMHLQQYEMEQEADLELITRLDLETRSAYDRLKEAVKELQLFTNDFPNAAQAATRAVGQLTMFKNAIKHLREAEMEHGWHSEMPTEVSEGEIDEFRDFLNHINPQDFTETNKEKNKNKNKDPGHDSF